MAILTDEQAAAVRRDAAGDVTVGDFVAVSYEGNEGPYRPGVVSLVGDGGDVRALELRRDTFDDPDFLTLVFPPRAELPRGVALRTFPARLLTVAPAMVADWMVREHAGALAYTLAELRHAVRTFADQSKGI